MRGWNVRGWIVLGIMGGTCCAAAQAPEPNPKLARNYANLSGQLEKQSGAKRAETLGRMAELEFDFARSALLAHQTAAGEHQLDLLLQHTDEACRLLQAETARGKTDGMRNVETSLQNIGYGLHGLDQDVGFQERAKVDAAATQIADQRDQLLQWMFAPKH